ncbi:MAG: hypothetical protein RL745_43 [Actinomycetota bacterium]
MRDYLLCLAIAATVTYVAVPPVRALALRWNVVAVVRARDVHTTPVPRLGGLAMLAGMCAAFAVASQLTLTSRVFQSSSVGRGLLVGAVLVAILGAIDDRFSLDAVTKIVGQVLVAAVVAGSGVQLLWIPAGGIVILDPIASIGLTVLVIVLMMNAVNFIDGLDGLAAGICLIAGLAFLAYSYLLSVQFDFSRATLPALVSSVLAGVALGFLMHNWHPARIFMGDTGSMLLGLALATSAVTLTGYVEPTVLQGTRSALPALLPLLLPVAVMAIPMLDLSLAVIRRARVGGDPFAPDKKHLHHRLLELGHSHRRAVALMYGWAALVSFTTVTLVFLSAWIVALAALIGLVVLGGLVFRWNSDPGPAGGLDEKNIDKWSAS